MLKRARREERDTIRAFMQPYLEELSRFTGDVPGPHGYEYPYLDFYWQAADRHPFIIEAEQGAVGFLLVRGDMDPENGSPLMEIAEIYLKPEARRSGTAKKAVLQAWSMFPGQWRVVVFENNRNALSFWEPLIREVDPACEERMDGSNHPRRIFTFRAEMPDRGPGLV